MRPPLSNLPVEILLIISAYLGSRDRIALCLTDASLYQKLAPNSYDSLELTYSHKNITSVSALVKTWGVYAKELTINSPRYRFYAKKLITNCPSYAIFCTTTLDENSTRSPAKVSFESIWTDLSSVLSSTHTPNLRRLNFDMQVLLPKSQVKSQHLVDSEYRECSEVYFPSYAEWVPYHPGVVDSFWRVMCANTTITEIGIDNLICPTFWLPSQRDQFAAFRDFLNRLDVAELSVWCSPEEYCVVGYSLHPRGSQARTYNPPTHFDAMHHLEQTKKVVIRSSDTDPRPENYSIFTGMHLRPHHMPMLTSLTLKRQFLDRWLISFVEGHRDLLKELILDGCTCFVQLRASLPGLGFGRQYTYTPTYIDWKEFLVALNGLDLRLTRCAILPLYLDHMGSRQRGSDTVPARPHECPDRALREALQHNDPGADRRVLRLLQDSLSERHFKSGTPGHPILSPLSFYELKGRELELTRCAYSEVLSTVEENISKSKI